MVSPTPRRPSSPLIAMLCAAAVSGQFIAGKATRDALFLTYLDVTLLPIVVMATSAFSIVLVAIGSKMLVRLTPVVFVPLALPRTLCFFWQSGFYAGCARRSRLGRVSADFGARPHARVGVLADRQRAIRSPYSPPAVRAHHGLSTLGGLVGALVAERVAALYGIAAMLPLLAVVNMVCAWQVRQLAMSGHRLPHARRTGWRTGAHRRVAGVGTSRAGTHGVSSQSRRHRHAWYAAATLADYVFKVQAVGILGRGDELLRFFAIYYAATSLLSFVVVGDWRDCAAATGTCVDDEHAVACPALRRHRRHVRARATGALVARGAESVFRGSLFRTGYEIFYTPVPSAGNAPPSPSSTSGSIAWVMPSAEASWLLLLLPAARQYSAILIGAIACSAAALVVARRLNRGYIETLERNLLNRALELDLSDVEDVTTRTVMLRTLQPTLAVEGHETTTTTITRTVRSDALQSADPEIKEILALRSRDRERVAAVLRDDMALLDARFSRDSAARMGPCCRRGCPRTSKSSRGACRRAD